MVETTPRSCSEPFCGTGKYLDNDWVCKISKKIDPLNFLVSQSFREEDLTHSEIALKVNLSTLDGNPLRSDHIDEYIPDLEIVMIDKQESLTKIIFTKNGSSSIMINADFAEGFKENSIELIFTPNTKKFSTTFSLVEEEQKIQI